MSDQELSELSAVEGSTANRPPKPIVEMTDEELTEWVQRMRNCLTQFQSLMAEARVSKDEKKQREEQNNLEMFE